MRCRDCRTRPIFYAGQCRECAKVEALRAEIHDEEPEPTAEQVERIVAEQYERLPIWWFSEDPAK